ncbi:NUDIX hydrolase [Kineosporia sp. NBRC 101731]|uniref:NUDIX hydrolase n=1 Tax=Kineosporia sp. NBRC 101731 TaxID=3032199 RepID=UPI002555EE1E|nr:NUDIX hydrolase [Kineosporia sp. NBRC 101731]
MAQRMTYRAEPFEHVVMADGVVVVAVDAEGRVALVRQNLPLHGEAVSVPGGMIEPGESPLEAARRELGEETGVVAEALSPLGVFAPMPRSTQRLHVFEASGLTVGDPQLTQEEVEQAMVVEWWPVEKAVEAVWDGLVQLSGSALALLAYSARRPSLTA